MSAASPAPAQPLRIFCIEDNALIIMHLEMLIEQAGHIFVGSVARFEDLQRRIDELEFDLALVDIDLADGRTGGKIACWLHTRGIPSLFVTGQERVAADYAHVSLGIVAKPVSSEALLSKLRAVQGRTPPPSS